MRTFPAHHSSEQFSGRRKHLLENGENGKYPPPKMSKTKKGGFNIGLQLPYFWGLCEVGLNNKMHTDDSPDPK